MPSDKAPAASNRTGSSAEVLRVFLYLGCISFGGPIAHLGYFQKEIVDRRKWCSEDTYAEIVGLAQSLPGPASSQVGFALGLLRAGWLGGLAAWIGFTLPSAVLMLVFAYGHSFLTGTRAASLLTGLQLVAVAVVAQAVMTMQQKLAPDRTRFALALTAAATVFFLPTRFSTFIAIAIGALAGLLLFRASTRTHGKPLKIALPRAAGMFAAAIFVLLLILLPLAAHRAGNSATALASAFYRSGALVFGGGHVVLPLLENAVVAPGWITQKSFLAGYGAVQAMPGPLFTFAAYLGTSAHPGRGSILYGLLALVALFLPGLLAMLAVLPFWSTLRERPLFQAALKGVNASVVGVLISALFRPLWVSTIHTAADFCIALLAFSLLTLWRTPPWIVVVGTSLIYMLAAPHG